MSGITATELELLECLATEPVLADPEMPWFYNDVTYHFEADGLQVTFKVHPSHQDICFIVRREGRPFYELKAFAVSDLRVLNFPGCDVFEIWLSTKEWLRIQIRPRFLITHGFEKLPPWVGVSGGQTILFKPEFRCSPLWVFAPPGNIPPDNLPISEKMRSALQEWANRYDDTFDQKKEIPHFSNKLEEESFELEEKKLCQALEKELGGNYEVIHYRHLIPRPLQ